jgi:hypothetical protein
VANVSTLAPVYRNEGPRVSIQTRLLEAGLVPRYAVAIVLTGVALLLSLVFEISFGNPFWFFFPCAELKRTAQTAFGIWVTEPCSTRTTRAASSYPALHFLKQGGLQDGNGAERSPSGP